MSARAATRFGLLSAALALSACTQTEALFPDPREERGWRLVGAYDSSALRTSELLLPEDDRPDPYDYKWLAPGTMNRACGVAKAPDGLGIFEAEAIANRMMPALVLVVERMGDVPTLDTARVRVAIGDNQPEFFLKPMVEPRFLSVEIQHPVDDTSARTAQQIKTQLQTYLCMEHKTGRAWQGGTLDEVRQALLLDPPDPVDQQDLDPSDEKSSTVQLPDRKFFGGQREPVAALMGPPSVCLSPKSTMTAVGITGGQGGSSLSLVPSDVWGANLEKCAEGVDFTTSFQGPPQMVFSLSELPEPAPVGTGKSSLKRGNSENDSDESREGEEASRKRRLTDTSRRTWSKLTIQTSAHGPSQADQYLEITYAGREMSAGPTGATHERVVIPDQPMFAGEDEGEQGLVDIISKLPYRYPAIGPESDKERYSLLIVPNWQLVEGVRRMHNAADGEDKGKSGGPRKLDHPRPTAGDGVQDGVGWILDHPDSLFVMIPKDPAKDPWEEALGENDWVNLAGVMSGGFGRLRDWGYTVGILAGRAPIALPGLTVPTWFQVSTAQRAPQHSLVLGAFAVLVTMISAGLVRLRDVWTRVPEERVDFWPGPPKEDEKGDNMAELNKASAGEEK